MKNYGFLIANLAAICWGYTYAQTENLLEKISPIAYLASSYLFGTIIFLPFLILKKDEIKNVVVNNTFDFFSTAVVITLAELFIIWSISLMGGTESAFIEVSYPIWTILFTFLILKTMPSLPVMMGGALIMIGSYIISRYSGT